MSFQVLDLKGKNFLNLLNDNFNPLRLSSIKSSLWLQYFGHSNSLCARPTRAIINYTSISEYRLRFFPRKEFSCSCGLYSIESR